MGVFRVIKMLWISGDCADNGDDNIHEVCYYNSLDMTTGFLVGLTLVKKIYEWHR